MWSKVVTFGVKTTLKGVNKTSTFASPFEKTATPRIVEPASFSIVRAYVIYIIIRRLSDPLPRNRLIRLLRIPSPHAT